MQAHSFDLFDTCITRMHAYPRDVFYDLGLRLAPASASEAARQRFARRFQRARIRAEKVANWLARREGREHADIEGIYRHLRWFMRTGRPTAEMVQAELALEEESLYPIDETVESIRRLRAAGHRILFISDMYIPARLLGPLLQRLGVMEAGDGLYVSCDLGCAKHSGRLFGHVLQAEGIAAADLVHTGDNAHADIGMAQAHGIQTVHFTPAHLTEREAMIAGKRIPRAPAASWQAAFSRRCRLAMRHAHPGEAEHPLDGVIFGVIVPFLLAYVLWVLDDARKRGIQRLYFVARDGEVLLKIAQAFKPEGVELRYLYGSRRAWLPAVANPDCDFWRNTLAVPGQQNAPGDIVARMGLDESEAQLIRGWLSIDESKWRQQLTRREATAFINRLLSHAKVQQLVARSAEQKSSLAKRYFIQEGMLDSQTWALVDAGWVLNTQAALERILYSDSPDTTTCGYYIGLSDGHLDMRTAGNAYAFTPAGSLFARRRIVVEHGFLPSTQDSVSGYAERGTIVQPNHSAHERAVEREAYARRLHMACEQCASLLNDTPALEAKLRDNTREIVNSAQNFLLRPTSIEASEFSKFHATPDMRQDSRFQRQILRSAGLRDFMDMLARTIDNETAFSSPSWIWPEGALALSPPVTRALFYPFFLMRRVGLLRT